MLETGDLIFVSENTEMGQAIQASTGNYSHVAIFLDGSIYHATVEGGVLAQSPEDFFEAEKVYDLYRYAAIDCPEVKKKAESLLGAPYNASFYPDGDGYYCSSSSLNYFLSLKPFPWSLEMRKRRLVRSGWITTRSLA